MNLAARFVAASRDMANVPALIMAARNGSAIETSFEELDRLSNGYAHGMRHAGLQPGDRVLMLVRPGPEFIGLVLGVLKAGLVIVLIDPGMDRAAFLNCVRVAAPRAMVAVPQVHLLAALRPSAFASIQKRWIAGWPWAPKAAERMRRNLKDPFSCEQVTGDATAAIIFTTGSTGTPKGVVYTHGNYGAELDLLRDRFGIAGGDVALAGYLPFAVLCLCLGSPCIVPEVHPARPATVDPAGIVDLVKRYRPVYGLGSPAFWGRVGEYCVKTGERLIGMRKILLFGAEVHESILHGLRSALPEDGEVHTPYGSTEAQPITTITDRELLDPKQRDQRIRLGVCVGVPLAGVEMRLIQVTDAPLSPASTVDVEPGGVGEVVVRGDAVTSRYFNHEEQDRLHKIGAPPYVWHRMGDCGSFDSDGRLWLAGRKSQRIEIAGGTLFPLPVEARVNRHPAVRRSALVGVGRRGEERPVVIVELNQPEKAGAPATNVVVREILEMLAGEPTTKAIQDVLIHPSLPVDYRHNAKIQREALARWAATELVAGTGSRASG